MPQKPTAPFGHLRFSKSGTVQKHMEKLSSNKEEQELESIQLFIDSLNQSYPTRQASLKAQLTQADHDFEILIDGQLITVQLTEMVDREYVFPMSKEEYDRCDWQEVVLKESGQLPWRVDIALRDAALSVSIDRKVRKHYSKNATDRLWLVVFTTDALYMTEYTGYLNGKQQLIRSSALKSAQQHLSAATSVVFDEIWFFNLQTKPVRVWPLSRP